MPGMTAYTVRHWGFHWGPKQDQTLYLDFGSGAYSQVGLLVQLRKALVPEQRSVLWELTGLHAGDEQPVG